MELRLAQHSRPISRCWTRKHIGVRFGQLGPPNPREGVLADVAWLVAARRKDLQLTQQEVAELTGLSRRTVQQVERGKGTVRLDILLRVLDAVGLSLAVVQQSLLPRLRDTEVLVLRPPAPDHRE